MSNNIKMLSEMERYEIINVNDGEKYNALSNNDIVFDEQGNLKLLVIHMQSGKFSFFDKGSEFLEIPWEYVKKIGSKTIILDVEEEMIKRSKL